MKKQEYIKKLKEILKADYPKGNITLETSQWMANREDVTEALYQLHLEGVREKRKKTVKRMRKFMLSGGIPTYTSTEEFLNKLEQTEGKA